MKKLIVFGALLLTVAIVLGCTHNPIPPDKTPDGAPLTAGLTCTTDSDCVFDAESDNCCANKNYVGTLGGTCPTEGLYVFKGMCTCNIPEGWTEGQCNGLIRTEPTSNNSVGNATPKE